MEIKQQLRLSQQLVMTPQLQQAIKLLQLSRLELIDEVRKELDNNPVLSEEDPNGRMKDAAATSRVSREERSLEHVERSDQAKETDKATREVDWEKFLENRTLQNNASGPGKGSGSYDDLPPIEQNFTRQLSLQDHLMWQLQMSDFTEVERQFAELVIGNLDHRGYLDLEGVDRPDGTRTPDLTIDDLADEVGLHRDDAPLVLEMIQRLDPVGVGSRNLRECLLLQAEVAGYQAGDTIMEIIENHIKDLERHNYQAIAKAIKLPLDEVYDFVKEIQTFESRPARNFVDHDERSIGITPDVFVVKDGDEFHIVDNDRGTQRLFINEALTRKLMADPQAKEFVGEKLRNAQWLIRAIEQRRKTILKVSECILEKQHEFFERGVSCLKPMILRDVADAVGMHESTISRVTTGKYMHCPQGLFELKYFFNSSIRRVSEDDIASESVKQAIKKMVEGEDKAKPLSDQVIVKLLSEEKGITIARRTVAKYREMLGILASSKRKVLF